MTPTYCLRELKRMEQTLKGAPESVTEYVEALADIPELVLHRAVSRALLAEQFFPTIAVIRVYCDEVAPRAATPLPDETAQSAPLDAPRPLVLTNPFTGEVKEIPIARVWKFYCNACDDSGWVSHRCPDKPCGRKFDHAPHEWVVKCACWAVNKALVDKRQAAAKYAKAPVKD